MILRLDHWSLIRGILLAGSLVFLIACRENPRPGPTPYPFKIPPGYPRPIEPADNPTTVEGARLGRYLFYDKRLSVNNSVSCASCHQQDHAFSDPRRYSEGAFGQTTRRHSMALVNVAFNPFTRFFWDGRAATLEEQVLHPIRDPEEMAHSLSQVEQILQNDPLYPPLFEAAFGDRRIDSIRIAKALAQFVRTLVSFNSRYDRWVQGLGTLDNQELLGLQLIQDNYKGDCFHCHNAEDRLFSNYRFSNNGLDYEHEWTDLGLYETTGNPNHRALFKVPTLRNVAVSAPYMHDGRFNTLDQVLVDHYLTGGKISPTIDPMMEYAGQGLNLSPNEVVAIKKFLLALTDSSFLTNPEFSDPFQ
ncbi:MAG: cytochrome-c peroxidase [Flavobacteriales bacterium]|nr:cytochrome-c peroxidase [Flavobacteriales bacterium]